MSCLSLRLPAAKKAWKSFTSKLRSKLLHKLHKSKAIKKPKNRLNIIAKANEHSLFFDQRILRKKHLIQPSHTLHFHHKRRCHLKKKSAPIYIDKLFKDQVVSELLVEHKCPPSSAKNIKVLDEGAQVPGTGNEGVERVDKRSVADDMWESVGLTSQQMHGIDERAEDFIVRFRAEMEVQEMLARRL